MDNKKVEDPEQARFIRKQRKKNKDDDEEQNEDVSFHSDPMRTINKNAKRIT